MIGSACSLFCVECSFLGREGAGENGALGRLATTGVCFVVCVFGEAVLVLRKFTEVVFDK